MTTVLATFNEFCLECVHFGNHSRKPWRCGEWKHSQVGGHSDRSGDLACTLSEILFDLFRSILKCEWTKLYTLIVNRDIISLWGKRLIFWWADQNFLGIFLSIPTPTPRSLWFQLTIGITLFYHCNHKHTLIINLWLMNHLSSSLGRETFKECIYLCP